MDALLSPRRRTVLQALGAASLLAACGERRAAQAVPAWEFRGPTMGSAYTLKLAGPGLDAGAAEEARDAVDRALARVDVAMSTHRPDSELSRFNRHPAGVPFRLSADTFAVFALAQRIAVDTGGAFDVTVAPLVDAWGFGPAREPRIVPREVATRLGRDVGPGMLSLDPVRQVATKAHDGVRADLSGIAKGYAVDLAAKALETMGVERFMVEAGGEVRTRGTNAEGRPWQIAIELPDAVPQRPHFVVPMRDLAMATSGDYRIYFEREGRRYCHEIDPAAGAPIRNDVASVSVVATDCGTADAMATALMVLGVERGLALAETRGLAAYYLVRTPTGLQAHASTAFRSLGGRAIA